MQLQQQEQTGPTSAVVSVTGATDTTRHNYMIGRTNKNSYKHHRLTDFIWIQK